MKLRLPTLLSLALAIAAPGLGVLPTAAFSEAGPLQAAAPRSDEDPNGARVIVKYRALGTLMKALSARRTPSARPQFANTLAQRSGVALSDGHVINAYSQVVHGDKSMSSAALATRLAADPEVEYAVPDLRRRALAVPNDALFGNWKGTPAPLPSTDVAVAVGQWYLRPMDSTFISAIDAQSAWDVILGSASVVVADVDTGVLFNHPDLAGKLLPGRNFVSTNGNTGAGWSADASDPGDWTTSADGCGTPEASSWHGTQTSSLLGAQTNNGSGMASVGYNSIKVLPVRVLGKCGGYDSDIIAGLYWAAGLADPTTGDPAVPANPNPAKVINMSLGGAGACNAAYASAINQITAKGVVVVVAAGNAEGLAVSTPGDCPGVIAVTGVRHVGTKVGFSSVGPEVAIAAPAGNCVNTSGPCLYPIITATNTGTTSPKASGYTYSDSTNYAVGTSFATPLVAGTAALMLSTNPALTPAQVKTLLQANARPFPSSAVDAITGGAVLQCHAPNGVAQDECICTTSTCGAGLLDAGAAVVAAAAIAEPTAIISTASHTVLAGSTVTFSGSGSTAPGSRSITSYQWAITSGSALAAFSGDSTGATASVVTSGSGSFTVQLTVTDSAGAQASGTSTVAVNLPAAPTVKVLASNTVVPAGSSVTFDGSGSTGSGNLTYLWSITDGAALASFTSSTNAATATVATPGAGSGSFTVTLTVTDSLGQQASTTSTVNVTPVVPTATINASATSVTAGGSVSFDGSGSIAPSGRTISSYQWTLTSGGAIATLSASGAAASVSTSAAGNFAVQLVVTDSAGAQGSRAASVTVNAVTPADSGAASPGKGGGAMSLAWVLGLAAAVAALRRRN